MYGALQAGCTFLNFGLRVQNFHATFTEWMLVVGPVRKYILNQSSSCLMVSTANLRVTLSGQNEMHSYKNDTFLGIEYMPMRLRCNSIERELIRLMHYMYTAICW